MPVYLIFVREMDPWGSVYFRSWICPLMTFVSSLVIGDNLLSSPHPMTHFYQADEHFTTKPGEVSMPRDLRTYFRNKEGFVSRVRDS